MKKILLFHVFPINNWKITITKLLTDVPHDDIFVHVSLPENLELESDEISSYLYSFNNVRSIFFSPNSKHPEVDAMEIFRSNIVFSDYSILTYIHTKGVTKPNNPNIYDWMELMRYFIIERMALCERVFKRGYLLYGVNRTEEWDSADVSFFYPGNFVSVNLTTKMIKQLSTTTILKDYHGLEGFWGKLCPTQKAYNAFYSRIDHYSNPFPEALYKNRWNRIRYIIVSFLYYNYYRLRQFIS